MRGPKGQVAVELAIVLPLALLFLFVLFELCLMFNARQMALLAAFRAARSFVAEKNHAHASASALQTLKPVAFRTKPENAVMVKVGQEKGKVRARVVLHHKPLFPLARLLGWKDLSRDAFPIAVSVELLE
jgi:Flp pilus assembly protein TadG